MHKGFSIFTALTLAAWTMVTARADDLQVIKIFPGEPKIVVDQGTEHGLEAGVRVDLVLKSGRRIPTRVTKSVSGKSLLAIPTQYQDRIKMNSSFAYEVGTSGASRSTASIGSSMSYSGSSGNGRNSLKGLAGMAGANMNTGLIVFGADYVIPVGRQFTIAPGVTYWHASGGVEAGDSWSFMTVDVAGGYHVPVGRKWDLELGGRLGMGRSSYTYPEKTVGGLTLPAESGSSMVFLITPYAGAGYNFSRTGSAGAEVRIPIAGSSDIGSSMVYTMGYVKFSI